MDLDATDVAILRALQADARLSYREIARRIGVSVPTISARVAALTDLGVLTGFHAVVDPERLGQVRVIVIARCAPAKTDGVGGALAAMPEVRWTVRTQGARVVAEAILQGPEAIDGFLETVARLDGVRGHEHHVAARAFKDEPRAVISDGLDAVMPCFECGRTVEGPPVRLRLDGRVHYFCCRSCESLYKERYGRIKAGASRTAEPRTGAPSR